MTHPGAEHPHVMEGVCTCHVHTRLSSRRQTTLYLYSQTCGLSAHRVRAARRAEERKR